MIKLLILIRMVITVHSSNNICHSSNTESTSCDKNPFIGDTTVRITLDTSNDIKKK